VALRPVSELGLVDLTDLASPDSGASGRRKPRSAGAAKSSPDAGLAKPPSVRGGPSKGQRPEPAGGQAKRASRTAPGGSQPGARSRPRGDATGKTTKGATQPRSPRVPPRGASAARVGILAATWAVAGVGGVLLGRAAVRR
jgi:hypothetical protein